MAQTPKATPKRVKSDDEKRMEALANTQTSLDKAFSDKLLPSPNHKLYFEFVKLLKTRPDMEGGSIPNLGIAYYCLSRSVSSVKYDYHELTSAIFAFDWLKPYYRFSIESYCRCMTTLVNADTHFLGEALKSLCRAFLLPDSDKDTPPVTPPTPSNASASLLLSPTRPNSAAFGPFTPEMLVYPTPPTQVHRIVHHAIKRVLELVPASPSNLFDSLCSVHPYKTQPVTVMQTFVRNLLWVSEYAHMLLDKILSLIVEKLIYIDVEVISTGDGDDDGWDEDDGDDGLSGLLGDVKKAEEESSSKAMAEKVDAIMCLMFAYLEMIKPNDPRCVEIYESLVRVFERMILKTTKSRFTQFLLFKYCGRHENHAKSFLRFLLMKALNAKDSTVERRCSIGYLASFVSRANYLHLIDVVNALMMMLNWTGSYIDSCNSKGVKQVTVTEAANHASFYHVAEAAMYILCYRSEELLHKDMSQQSRLSVKRQFTALINSSLNPLRFCGSDTVTEFASAARVCNIVDCTPVIADNAKLSTVNARGNPLKSVSSQQQLLTLEFPLRPYMLRNSSKFLSGMYREYVGLEEKLPKATKTTTAPVPISQRGRNQEDEDVARAVVSVGSMSVSDTDETHISLRIVKPSSLTSDASERMQFVDSAPVTPAMPPIDDDDVPYFDL